MKLIWDWKRQWGQGIIIAFILIVTSFIDINTMISNVLTKSEIEMKEIPLILRIGMGCGSVIIGITISVYLIIHFRKLNKEETLKQNIPNAIVRHSLVGYWCCRYIFNYQTVNLTRVPIPIQFKLLCYDWFNEYIYDGINEKTETEEITVTLVNIEQYTTTINLVLSDTYPISIKRQLPANVLNLTTIHINRSSSDRTRYHSREFVTKVVSALRDLPSNVNTVNLFCTLNPSHCIDIAKEGFMTGGRDSIKHLSVFQQTDNNGRIFNEKGHKIY